jgi:Ca2+-binding RTX toxin-like protein
MSKSRRPGGSSAAGAARVTRARGRPRRRAGFVGALAVLAFVVQLTLASPAAAQPFTGAFSPTIIGERADLNGDGVVDGADDSNAFYGDTSIIDGMLDCNAWGATPNAGTAGDGVILPNDDCILIGYDGTADGLTIVVSGGEFQVANGLLPTVFNAADPDNPDIGDSDFAWSAIGGRVDSNGDETISGEDCHFGLIGETVDVGLGDPTDGADILGNPGANECGFVTPPAGANNGYVDLNSDTLITVADSCSGCFFGLDVASGLVQAPGPETIALAPADDTNTVGTDHTVTATVEDLFGNPVSGEAVHFAVAGDGTPVPAAGDVVTDAAGEAALTFTNETAGENTITACVDADADMTCDPGELSATATKTWEPGPAVAIALEPATDTNPVGTDHTVTATVTDEFGNPVAGEDVHFDVTGDPTPVPAAGHDITDADGLATFEFTNNTAGTNTITACIDADAGIDCDPGEESDTATKTWQVRVATSIAVAPPTDTNRVGTSHTVTATVLDQFGDPFAGQAVHFAVTGAGTPVPTGGNDTTDATGLATFAFTNNTAGTNTITACIDVDTGSDCDVGEASASATKTWTPVCPGFAADPRNQVVGTPASEVLVGTAGADIICGLGGNDTLIGLGGNDLLLGGAGADVLRGGAGADTLRGGAGADTLRGGGGNDRLFGDGGNDRLFGDAGSDQLFGGLGNDQLFGGLGNDRLFGGGGRDRLDGGPGRDRCVGGPARDRFLRCEIRVQ